MLWWLNKVESHEYIAKFTGYIPAEVDCVGGGGDLDRYLEFDLVLFGDEVLVTYLLALLLHYFL